jgi:hypothetical protein
MPDAVILPPSMAFDHYVPWVEEDLRWLADKMPTDEERLARKVEVEFRI